MPSDDHLNHWMRSMQDRLTTQREHLQTQAPESIAQRSGAAWKPAESGGGQITLQYFQTPLVITVPDFHLTNQQGATVDIMTEALVIAYLEMAAGAPRTGQWIAFRELPGGTFYHQAFTGYTGQRLARYFGNDLAAIDRSAQAVGGIKLPEPGDAAYEFQILPHLWLATVCWSGDPEDGFPPQASVLFDQSASAYMVLDGLAILGSQLVSRLIKTSKHT
jgi:hypothetical protein